MAKYQFPDFSKESIVTSIGLTVVQTLDYLAKEMNLNGKEIRLLWSPFLAATTRMVRPADNMVEYFLMSSQSEKVRAAIFGEKTEPNLDFYQPFSDSVRDYLKILTESIEEVSYLPGIENLGLVDKQYLSKEISEMLNFYVQDQNSKSRKVQPTDGLFEKLFAIALPQHVEDTLNGYSVNGMKNTGEIIQIAQVVFGTALLLQIISGMAQ